MTTTECKAKNKSRCRYHRVGNFTDDIITLVTQGRMFPVVYNGTVREGFAEDTLKLITAKAVDKYASYLEENPTSSQYAQDEARVKAVQEAKKEISESLFDDRDKYEHAFYAPVKDIATGLKLAFNRSMKPTTTFSQKNFLEEENPEPFDKAAQYMVLEEGSVVSTGNSYYGGWQDDMSTAHLKKCGVAYMSKPQEETRYSFAGTFADADQRDHGLSSDVRCNCNAVQGTLRAENDFETMTRDLVNKYAKRVFS